MVSLQHLRSNRRKKDLQKGPTRERFWGSWVGVKKGKIIRGIARDLTPKKVTEKSAGNKERKGL